MSYLVVGPSIVNDIEFEDGTVKKSVIGGSIFCVAGIKLWTDECIYISNIGRDYKNYYGEWMEDNHCSYSGLNEILPHTQYTKLIYGKEGLHDEFSIYGTDEEKTVNELDKIDLSLILKHCNNSTKGIYIEANIYDSIWNSIQEIKSRGNIKVMWELPTSVSADKDRHEPAFHIINKIDIFSINLPEAKMLFGVNDEDGAIKKIIDLKTPCYFRVGKKGSYMICNNNAFFSGSIALGNVIDTTGCGNCSTAAALVGFCEHYEPGKIATMGNIAAAYNLLQYGPYPRILNIRDEAFKRLN
ncbi:MAG: PfkB family carbohydrate kinase [Proteiniphilum sp.]|jgi:sugar/nucleoside kinase (ribokinase family)|nr:PfkB family carbohydrate kinase [Proteiniphilum sp.]